VEPQTPALEMIQIDKRFPGVHALDQVSLTVRPGEIHALMGENGAGKSTLMKILFGAISKDSGIIRIKGNEVNIRTPSDAQHLGVSMVHQELNLVPQMNAAQNIFLGRAPTTAPFGQILKRGQMKTEAARLLEQLGASIRIDEPVRNVSIAHRQMIEIAKALSYKADVLVMDEPTSSLTDKEIRDLFAALRRLTADGVAIVFVSHRIEEIFEISDRITVLRDGRTVGTVNVKETTSAEVIRMMVGRDLQDMFPKQFTPRGDEVIRLEGVSMPGVLQNISLNAHRGEVLGIVGLVGAGRSEVAQVMFGCAPGASGQLFLDGKLTRLRSPQQAIGHGIGFLTADRKGQGLVLSLAVQNNIALASLNQISSFGFISFKQRETAAYRYREELDIRTPDVQRPVRALSGGNQQKVVLAKWLFSKARILIFEEPTRGVDVGAKVEIYQLMNALVAQGVCIIMISSELPEVMGMSDRILVMRSGRIVSEMERNAQHRWSETAKEEILRYAMGEVTQ